MFFKQFYLGCLAHASYLIASNGEAAVIDPQRDVQQYLDEAAAQNARIKYIIETHLHADFVSGHLELAERSGATIVFGQAAGAKFNYHPVKDQDELPLGDIQLRFLETPGHTPESICIVVLENGQPRKVLTGDTLFIGDVGRPDLAGAKGFTPQFLAGQLYDSLHQKLLTLDDAVEVYPAHGAGSLCGRNISKQTSSTIGEQRLFNYALQPMPRDAFIQMLTTDLPEAPAYFSNDAELNREGAAPLLQISRPIGLAPAAFQQRMAEGAVALDVRSAAAFGAGHVPGAINIGLGGQFASWVGSLVPLGTPLLLITDDDEQVDEAVTRLARVGMESAKAFLAGGMYAWNAAGLDLATLRQMPIDELRHCREELQIIDVRRPAEYRTGHLPGARNVPLNEIPKRLHEVDSARATAVICAGGYRSSAAASLLEPRGFPDLFNVVGGTQAWIQAGAPVETEDAVTA
jgi:glyoxylase-like metal-dependent hydrolase (beta-lactamase superfamily II)/rhodanese-related sulfurtransferase